MSFADQLRKWRKAKGLTQLQLAQKLGRTQGVIAHYEKGIRKPDLDVVPEIARILGVAVEALYGLVGSCFSSRAKGQDSRSSPRSQKKGARKKRQSPGVQKKPRPCCFVSVRVILNPGPRHRVVEIVRP